MKVTGITLAVLLVSTIALAVQPVLPGNVANLPACRGIATADVVTHAANAQADPAKTYAQEHQRRFFKRLPREVRCASAIWNALRAGAAPVRTAAPTGAPSQYRGTDAADIAVNADPPNDLRPVHPVLSPPLRSVRPLPPPHRGEEEIHPEPIIPPHPTDGGPDLGPHQMFPGAAISAPTATGLSFDGVGVGLGTFQPNVNPPDVEGRVGATQYVQWNNLSFAVFDKTTGALLYGPAAGNTLFQSLGGACATHNDGDPVVSYDIIAGRWVLSQFVVGASPNYSHQCVAVSLTGDATGAYYLYDFVTDAANFVDYPKTAVWPDGYYMSAHVFNTAGTSLLAGRVYVFERAAMINGQAARMQSVNLPKDGSGQQYGFLVADLDSITPPPAGAQEYIIGPNQQFLNRTNLWRLAVTWGVAPTITLSAQTTNNTVGIDNAPCVSTGRACVPQLGPGGGTNVPADNLDNLRFHYMYRLAYMNHGGIESLLTTGTTTGAATTPAHGAIKWMEWRGATGSNPPTLFQSGTYDPTPTQSDYRWMPSIAMDGGGNIALGYSRSSNTTRPSIWLTGRLSTDTAGTMGAETQLQSGSGVQQGAGNRWGDYSAMTLDPIDQCTFYYTNEYLKTDGGFNWSTRIASYKFPSCTSAAPWGTLTGTITSAATGAPISGVTVNLSNGFNGTSNASGVYSIVVPAGTYTATVTGTDRSCTTSSPATTSVLITSGSTTSQNFLMTGTSNVQFNSVAIDDSIGNGNGVINSNECSLLNVTLKNNGCATESAITATLTTTTTGVTVVQGSASYPDLVIDASGVNSVPFKIQTSNTFVCGTAINFTLNLTYASGGKAIGFSVPTCAGGANQTIPLSSLTTADTTQGDRLGRDGVPSTCSGKACPGGGFAGTKYYKTFSFTNSGGGPACFTVTINAAAGGAGDIESAAYLGSYNPASLCTNYLGDSGITGLGTTATTASYSFTVPAASTFVVVVNTTGTTTSSQFSGTVSGFFDFTPGPGGCCTSPATPTASNTGPYCAGGTISLSTPTVSGATYSWTGPNGFTSTLQNPTRANATAADAGTYSVTVTVNGCTSPAGTTNVVVNPIPATPSASNTGPYCAGGTISLSTPTVSGATYSWTGPNSFTSTQQNPTISSATVANAGTYSVTVTVNNCPSLAGTTNVVVNPIPATPSASNSGPYCEGGTISLSTPAVSGATYSWTGPNSFTSTLQNPTRANATLADAGAYSVTITVNGCPSAAGTTNVVVNATPATPSASNGGPYCEGATISLSTPAVSGATYSWSGPNGFTSPLQNPTIPNATVAAAGTYSVTVTVNNCPSPAGTTNVVVNPIPATPSASNSGPYCEGGTISLSTPAVSGATYSWTGPNGFTSPLQNPTIPNATVADAGTYSVTITLNGCSSAAGTTDVVVNPLPAMPSPTNGGPYCEGATISLFTPTVSGATYSWTGPNGFTSTDQNPTRANATVADAGTYSVTITVNSCTSPAGTTDVVVNPAPATPLASNGGPYCEGATISLSTAAVSGATYSWTGPNGFTSAQQNPTIPSATVADAGTYSVTVTVNGCTSQPGTTDVVVNAIPATPGASNGGPYCEGATILLSTATVTGASYSWTGPNGFTSTQQNPTRANATLADAGTYSVTITLNGCPSAAGTTDVVVNPVPATPSALNGGPYCEGATILLSTPTVTGATYSWTGPNGFTSLQQNPTIPNATIANAGTYFVTVTLNGCASAPGSTDVVVNPVPAMPSPSNGGPYCEGATISLSTPTVAGATYSWTGPNGFTSTDQNPTRTNATLADAGDYSVAVTVNGCTSVPGTTTVVVNATPATPTITPNGLTTFCEGGSVTLTSDSPSGNQWYVDGNLIPSATSTSYIASTGGSYTVVVTTSGCSSAASAAVDVVVIPTPPTPTATNGGPYVVGDTISLSTPTVTGATYSWTGPNSFTSAVQNPTIANATTADAGTYAVTITLNGCPSLPGTTDVVVTTQANQPPVLNPIGNKTVAEGSLLTFTVTGSDPDGDTLTFSATNLPTGAVFDVPTATFSWTPGFDQSGSYDVTFGVSDGRGGTASETITITVTNTNRPPVLDPIGNQIVAPGATLAFAVSATDPDGDTVTYGVTNLPAGATFNTSTGAFSWTPAGSQAGNYSVTFSASDGNGGTASETITITVTPPIPTGVVANGVSPTSVSVTWNASTGASGYEILRRDAGSGFAVVGTSPTLAFVDNSASANSAYLYAVRAFDASANRSGNSAPDLATTFVFTDDPLVPGTTIVSAVHFEQLRSAIDAVRALAGLAPGTYTDPVLAGVVVQKLHLDEMRFALDEARIALSLGAWTYTDPTIAAGTTFIKAAHVTELRDALK